MARPPAALLHSPPVAKLSVNVNKVATLRNTRPLGVPSVLDAARRALDAGAHGVTIHPRPDERHIRPPDVDDLAALLRDRYPHAEFNIEGNPFEGRYVEHCRRVRPTQCTLVPDAVGQATSDHGWNLRRDIDRLRPVVAELKGLGCRVSLFMNPTPAAMPAAKEVGADRVELYTEPFARRFDAGDARAADDYAAAARAALDAGLGVNAGHDLTLENLGPFLAAVPGVAEVSIGHALIADALQWGLAETVRRYLAACA